jgi:glycosyltransferase involved in cell wall biosynthesis
MDKQPILSICIPTWNRAKILSASLDCFREQLVSVNSSEVELFVSDNCSDDDTPHVVQSFIDQGLPITYNRNPENLGAARNFIKCMQWASGKYIWLLGDDDLLKPGAIAYILDLIRNGDYGLVHLSILRNKLCLPEVQEYDDRDEFLKTVSYWITFMSGCIFLKESVSLVENCERFIPTHLLQMPFYIMSSSLRKKNLVVRKTLIDDGLDSNSNGGYNFYQVFVESYLSIWREYLDCGIVTKKCYNYIKKHIYWYFIVDFNYSLLLRRKNVKDEKSEFIGNRKGFKIKGAWRLLLKHYGLDSYFYISFGKYVLLYLKDLFKKDVK